MNQTRMTYVGGRSVLLEQLLIRHGRVNGQPFKSVKASAEDSRIRFNPCRYVTPFQTRRQMLLVY